MPAFKSAVAVIPARNEAASVASVVRLALNHLEKVVVVNDASSDNTGACAAEAGAITLDLLQPSGYSAALLAGCRHALEAGAQTVVMLDADGAHDPEDIPVMLAAHARASAQITVGNRFHVRALSGIPSPKRWANFFATSLVNQVLETSLPDIACGFRVLSSDYARVLIQHGPFLGFSLAFHCLALAHKHGFKIANAPVGVRYSAVELACTSRGEFADLLVACSGYLAPGSTYLSPLHALQGLVDKLAPATIAIGGERICIFPLLPEAYVFQQQPRYFHDVTLGQLVVFPDSQ